MSGEVDSEEEELEGGSSKRRATLQALALGTRNANDVVEVQSFEIDPTMVGLFGHELCVLARKLTCTPFDFWLQVEEVKRQCLIADPPVPLLAECVARGTCAPCSVATHPHVIKPANAASYGSRLGRSMRKSATSTLAFATGGRDMPCMRGSPSVAGCGSHSQQPQRVYTPPHIPYITSIMSASLAACNRLPLLLQV